MRYFKLMNSTGAILDITTIEILFHEIGGLGFEEDNDFRQIGEVWWLNNSRYNQATVTGKVIFTENGGTDPYEKYYMFARFVQKAPLILMYYPYGVDGECFRRRVRVSKLDKTEKTELGVIDSDIEFVCYTPWYKIVDVEYNAEDREETPGWVWGGSNNPPLVFEPSEGRTATRAKFRYEAPKFLEIKTDTTQKCPVKLMIFGPLSDPSWTMTNKINESFELVGSGGFSTPINIADDEILVIDNTDGRYAMEITALDGSVRQNVYQLRNFDLECFVTLREGENRIAVTAHGGTLAKHIKMEGHIYHATV